MSPALKCNRFNVIYRKLFDRRLKSLVTAISQKSKNKQAQLDIFPGPRRITHNRKMDLNSAAVFLSQTLDKAGGMFVGFKDNFKLSNDVKLRC